MTQDSPFAASATGRAYRRLASVIRAAIETSRMRAVARSLTRTFEAALQGSAVARAGVTVNHWIQASFLFRWLTAEPDPEVIVIDLRETRTVGPILMILDRLVTGSARRWRGSTAEQAAAAVRARVGRQPVRVVSAVLLVALVTEALLSALLGGLSPGGMGGRLLVAALALAGTRVHLSWAEVTETAPYRFVATALAPPESPEAGGDGGDDQA